MQLITSLPSSAKEVLGESMKGFFLMERKLLSRSSTLQRNIRTGMNFFRMIEVMSHIQHRNVNRILGCFVENGRRIVVSEYEEHGDLSSFLSGSDRLWYRKDWERRAGICIGVARGLSYLYEDVNPHVIHGDIKSSYILLDKNFDPKIADFYLVAFRDHLDEVASHSVISGSFGYLDPEYMRTHVYTDKADVYSFGVLMLEIISGRKAVGFPKEFSDDGGNHSMLNWALRLRKTGRIMDIVDPILLSSATVDNVKPFLDVAVLCCQGQSKLRSSMSEVVYMLYGGSNFSREAIRKLEMSRTVASVHSKDWIFDGRVPAFSLTTSTFGSSDEWVSKQPSDSTSQIMEN